jgi:hypothetical protein
MYCTQRLYNYGISSRNTSGRRTDFTAEADIEHRKLSDIPCEGTTQ